MPATIDCLSQLEIAPPIAAALGSAAASIGRLDGRVSISSVAPAWRLRSAWSGYARALQLQGVEVDEIDAFSWGCDLPLSDRPRRSTTIDEFEAFAGWWSGLFALGSSNWRDTLSFTPVQAPDAPAWPGILRALEIMRQSVRHDPSIAAWLRLPALLKGFGVTEAPLPCLVEGAKAFRLRARPSDEDWRAILRALGKAADGGLERLERMEAHQRQAVRAVLAERRPGALPALLALAAFHPLLSPQMVSGLLKLSLPGAGKLLARAAELGFLHEISGRRAWKRYIVPDLAVRFGFIAAPRGRPKAFPEQAPINRDLSSALESFDAEMRAFELRFGKTGEADDGAYDQR